ncbi:MAG TPA: protein translocase subunit SecF [candidate division Zixibacteria bacterium]|nr:protein translocase subunit SecF [candidate division Zixibacteria bacterium]
MEFLKDTNWDFLGKRKAGFVISGILLVLAIVAFAMNLISQGDLMLYGIDFKGGEVIEIGFDSPVDVGEIRSIVETAGVTGAEIQSIGDGSIVVFRLPAEMEIDGKEAGEVVLAELKAKYGDDAIELRLKEVVGPKVSGELKSKALWATLLALIGILVYVTIRFQFRFGVAAVVALFHDVIITVGVLTILRTEISLPVVAGILTIVGYSINDTIVISDRIRENARILFREKFSDLVNRSLNQTITRTMITSLTTFLVVLCIFLFGGPVIRDFSLALLIGIIVGTYSSIFVVSPIVVAWENVSPKRIGAKR